MNKDELIQVEHLLKRINRIVQVNNYFIRLKFVKLYLGSKKT
jgi:hypothetical protein